jgi:hypothetical protein
LGVKHCVLDGVRYGLGVLDGVRYGLGVLDGVRDGLRVKHGGYWRTNHVHLNRDDRYRDYLDF